MRLTKDSKYVLDQFIAHPPDSPGEVYDYIIWSQFIDEKRLTIPQYRGILEELEAAGCIKWVDGSNSRFYLLESGRNYKELAAASARELWKNRILSFLSGILVTVLAQIIIQLVGGKV